MGNSPIRSKSFYKIKFYNRYQKYLACNIQEVVQIFKKKEISLENYVG